MFSDAECMFRIAEHTFNNGEYKFYRHVAEFPSPCQTLLTGV